MIRTFGLSLHFALMTFLFVSASSAACAQQFQTVKSASDQLLGGEIEGARWSICFEEQDVTGMRVLERDSLMAVATNTGGHLVNYYTGQVYYRWNFEEGDLGFTPSGSVDHLFRVREAQPSASNMVMNYWFTRTLYFDFTRIDSVYFPLDTGYGSRTLGRVDCAELVPGSSSDVLVRFHSESSSIDRHIVTGYLTIYNMDAGVPDRLHPWVQCGAYGVQFLFPDGRFCLSRGINTNSTPSRVGETTYQFNLFRIKSRSLQGELPLPAFNKAVIANSGNSFLLFTENNFAHRYLYDAAADSWSAGDAYDLDPIGVLTHFGTHYIQLNREQTALEMIDLSTGAVVAECDQKMEGKVEGLIEVPQRNLLLARLEGGIVAAVDLCEEFLFATDVPTDPTQSVAADVFNILRQTASVVELEVNADLAAELTVCNLRGSVVYRQNLKGVASVTIDTQSWPAGMYLIQCRDGNRTKCAQLIVR